MTAAIVYLVLAASGAAATFIAASNGRRPPRLGALYWLLAWFVVELPWHHLALSLIVTALAAAQGAFQHWPGWLGLALVIGAWPLLLRMARLGSQAHDPLERALQDGLGADYRAQIAPAGNGALDAGAPLSAWLRPFRVHDRAAVERVRDIAYGPAGVRNQLDVYRPRDSSLRGAPVLLQIHGGAWVFGEKEHQGRPLMNEMARRGWVCVAPNYRLSPKATFPDHLIDCKRALAWVRAHIADYGGDPGWVAVTGGSAGGHLATLLALTANDPEYQPGFEAVDTSIQAAVPFYGAYDFLQHNGVDITRASKPGFVETQVMKSSPSAACRAWERASPIRWVHAEAPPFFVIHGDHDSLVWVEGARDFVAALRRASRLPVAYAELPGAQHAFDIFNSPRCLHTVQAVARFLAWARAARPPAAGLMPRTPARPSA
jgi:acetyl esterase/lipase